MSLNKVLVSGNVAIFELPLDFVKKNVGITKSKVKSPCGECPECDIGYVSRCNKQKIETIDQIKLAKKKLNIKVEDSKALITVLMNSTEYKAVQDLIDKCTKETP